MLRLLHGIIFFVKKVAGTNQLVVLTAPRSHIHVRGSKTRADVRAIRARFVDETVLILIGPGACTTPRNVVNRLVDTARL